MFSLLRSRNRHLQLSHCFRSSHCHGACKIKVDRENRLDNCSSIVNTPFIDCESHIIRVRLHYKFIRPPSRWSVALPGFTFIAFNQALLDRTHKPTPLTNLCGRVALVCDSIFKVMNFSRSDRTLITLVVFGLTRYLVSGCRHSAQEMRCQYHDVGWELS